MIHVYVVRVACRRGCGNSACRYLDVFSRLRRRLCFQRLIDVFAHRRQTVATVTWTTPETRGGGGDGGGDDLFSQRKPTSTRGARASSGWQVVAFIAIRR